MKSIVLKGKDIGDLLDKRNSGKILDNYELNQLAVGMEFIASFCAQQKLRPMVYYYASELESIERGSKWRRSLEGTRIR